MPPSKRRSLAICSRGITKKDLSSGRDNCCFRLTLARSRRRSTRPGGQLALAQAQRVQDEAQLATAEANELQSRLNVEKYAPLAKERAASQQDLDNADQTN